MVKASQTPRLWGFDIMTELVLRPNLPGDGPQTQDPTAALRRTLTAFKSILTEDQRAKFVANCQKPDIADVLSFVAEIDANNNNSQAKRCVAPRLYTFLESTQRFTAIVDTFVSSNPQISALVWGGVKVAILTASNISSFFEKVTAMIMEIGKTCPKYQQFGQLYPGCVGLQGELCEYYAVIVQICIKIIEISRRAPVSQILSSVFSPFECEFQPLLGQLDQTVKNVRLEISLAANQAIEEMRGLLNHEAQSNNSFRLRTLKFQERSQKGTAQANEWRLNKIKRENSKLRSAIKDNLSTINFSKPWKQALRQRVPLTAEWLFEEPLFCEWRYDFINGLLWCPGKMGVGKTIMMSNVVPYLHRSRRSREVIAYYFATPDDPTSLTAKNLFGIITRQLIESQLELETNEKLQELEQRSKDLDAAQIADFRLSYLHDDKEYIVVLDGLDEFSSEEIKAVSYALGIMQARQNLKIICAGRPGLEKTLFRSSRTYHSIPIMGHRVDQDIDQFLSAALSRRLEEESLKLRDPGLILKISDTLRERSNGM